MACDPFWNKTVLACHFDGPNGSTTFTDEKGHTLTANGNAQLTTTAPKIGTACATFDGAGDYIVVPSSADYDFGGGDFTVEFWFKSTQNLTSATMVSREWGGSPYSNGWSCELRASTSGPLRVWSTSYSTGTPLLVGTTTTHGDGNWHHFAWTRSGSMHRLFLDGNVEATATSSGAFSDAVKNITIGANLTFTGRDFNGQIDGLRITKADRYTGNFTPDTSAFLTNQCTISGTVKDASGALAQKLVRIFQRDSAKKVGEVLSDTSTGGYSIEVESAAEHFVLAHDTTGDPFWNKTVLACHFDGPNGSTTFTDEKGHTLTANGNAQISTAQSKFGGASLRLSDSNNGSENVYASNADFDLSSEVFFTVEGFINTTSWDTYSYVVSRGNSDTRSWAVGITATYVKFYWSTNGSSSGDSGAQASFSFSLNTWYHVAVVKAGSTLSFFVDGALIGTGTFSSMYGGSGPLRIGTFMDYTAISHCFRGYIDDLRVTKGARYTDSFPLLNRSFYTGPFAGTENAVILDRVVPV